jgi:flagellar hook-basal body complex protein FliE
VTRIGPPSPPIAPPLPSALRGSSLTPRLNAQSTDGPANPTTDFAKLLFGKLDEANTMQTDADDMVHQMLTGGDVNQAEVLTAVQKADLAFRMMLQVRNKLIEAYRELQQIQI